MNSLNRYDLEPLRYSFSGAWSLLGHQPAYRTLIVHELGRSIALGAELDIDHYPDETRGRIASSITLEWLTGAISAHLRPGRP